MDVRVRDRALEQRLRIRDLSIALASAGTIIFASVAAATIPGHTAQTGGSQASGQVPSGGTSPLVSGSASSGGGLQPPQNLPTQGQGSGGGVVTGGS